MILKNSFRKERKSLQSKGLLYLEQIIYTNSMLMREWKNIKIKKNLRIREKKPKW